MCSAGLPRFNYHRYKYVIIIHHRIFFSIHSLTLRYLFLPVFRLLVLYLRSSLFLVLFIPRGLGGLMDHKTPIYLQTVVAISIQLKCIQLDLVIIRNIALLCDVNR